MEFSLNSQGNNANYMTANENKSGMNEDGEMKNANTNIQMNISDSSSLVIKNTLKLVGGLALAGMIVVTTTFGSVSADEPSRPISNDYYTGSLTDIPTASANVENQGSGSLADFTNASVMVGNQGHGSLADFANASVKVQNQGYGSLADFTNEPNIVKTYIPFGPDVVEQSRASAYIVHGPDVVEPASAYIVHGPDTSEWNG